MTDEVGFHHERSTVAPPNCSTCVDEAVPAKVLKILDESTAVASRNASEIEIDISLVENVQVGDTLLVHAGVALSLLTADEIET